MTCSAIPKQNGKVSLCYLLTEKGHLLSEATIARLGEDHYWLRLCSTGRVARSRLVVSTHARFGVIERNDNKSYDTGTGWPTIKESLAVIGTTQRLVKRSVFIHAGKTYEVWEY